jgi:hypothetical protein
MRNQMGMQMMITLITEQLFMRAMNCLDSSRRNYKRSGGYVMCVEFRGSCQKQGVKRYFVTWTGACEMRNLLNTL